ncbi:hypothetical protein FHT12_000508 [Xanthomonas campestris]|nr:hypothetical protein [Xanthomonas euroxanthea]
MAATNAEFGSIDGAVAMRFAWVVAALAQRA